MRRLYSYVLAAIAACGVPLAAYAQVTAPAKQQKSPTLVDCAWEQLGRFPGLAPRAVAIGRDGSVLLAADDLSEGPRTALVVMRQAGSGAPWEVVDRYLPPAPTSTGARALHVDDDGNVFVLGWQADADHSWLILRRSLNGGASGTWENAETRWPISAGAALTSDSDGRVYVAYGFATAQGIGWRVESALRGIGAFLVDDEITFERVGSALPQDIEHREGQLWVAGQLDGSPDEWVVRNRPGRSRSWRTLDRFQLTANAYGLAPRALIPIADGRLLVAGLGVRGGGRDDYQWIERWQNARGRWKTVAYQLAQGFTAMAQDAAPTRNGVAVLGVGYDASGGNLLLRESTDGGTRWQTALQIAGVTDPWSARMAISGASAAVAATVRGAAVVLGCSP